MRMKKDFLEAAIYEADEIVQSNLNLLGELLVVSSRSLRELLNALDQSDPLAGTDRVIADLEGLVRTVHGMRTHMSNGLAVGAVLKGLR